jgi:hypothetical protein
VTWPTERLDFAVVTRLREVVNGQSTTESEVRTLSEQADAWARTLEAQIRASEHRLRELEADATSPLTEIATEIRRVDTLLPELAELRSLLAGLEERTRELRTAWLKRHAGARPAQRSNP